MKCVFVVLFAAVLACCSANHVKRQAAIVAPAYYSVPTAYSSSYVAAPLVSSAHPAQYVASPLVSSAYVPASNPVIARASRVFGEPGFVSRYVAAPVATPVATPVADPLSAVDTVETLATPTKLVAPVAAVRTAAPLVVSPARYTYVA